MPLIKNHEIVADPWIAVDDEGVLPEGAGPADDRSGDDGS